jgi:hypothetical protein
VLAVLEVALLLVAQGVNLFVVVLAAVAVLVVAQQTLLVVLVARMKQTHRRTIRIHGIPLLAAAVLEERLVLVLVRLVHRSVSVAVAAVHPTRLQAVLEVQVVLVQAVAEALVQTATMMVVPEVLAVTPKLESGYSDEIPRTQHARRSDEHCCLGWCHTVHTARCERTVAMRRTCRRVLRLAQSSRRLGSPT